MSSIPGLWLEDFLAWEYDLIVEEDGSANPSLQIAEAMGVDTRRLYVTNEQFGVLLSLYEPFRDIIEYKLEDFDEETQSWRDYGGFLLDYVSDGAREVATNLVNAWRGV